MKKYHYTGFTSKAIYKTQNTGYQNNYYYLVGNITSLKIIENIMSLLSKKNNKEFKEGMKNLEIQLITKLIMMLSLHYLVRKTFYQR